MSQLYTNNAISLLNNNLSPGDLIIHLIPGDGALFPQPQNDGDFFLVTLEDNNAQNREIVKIGNRINDQLFIVERGFENTIPQFWPEDTLVDHRITAFELRKIDQLRGNITDANEPIIALAGSSKQGDIFAVSFPNNLACKWLVTVLHEATGKISVSEILAAYRGLNETPSYSIYAKTGDKLQYDIQISVSGQNMILNVENNDTVDLRINCIRINY